METTTGPTGNTLVLLCVSTVQVVHDGTTVFQWQDKYGHRTGITLDTITLEQEQQLYNISANSQTKASLTSQETYNYPSYTTIYSNAASIY